jgi:putative membrane-bound dehydrogenase-like protein
MRAMGRFVVIFLILAIGYVSRVSRAERLLKAGAAIVDISPTSYPVIVNAMFTERSGSKTVDPLTVRAVVLDNSETRLAIAVVDTCMMPRDLIDRAKRSAAKTTGIPAERMMISATHTHSAPAAMGCLGSRADTNYAAFLPGRIAEAIENANAELRPARIGWGVAEDWDHTFNRRWIRRPDRMIEDPFGMRSVRAHMHPGHESGDVTGPSGPVDPALSIIAIETVAGKPLALLANYSQHYYGSPLLSSDYFGRFAAHMGTLLGATNAAAGFVGIMSQGTSGDLMWMDYGAPKKDVGYDAYARQIAERVRQAYLRISFTNWVELKLAERKLALEYRAPNEQRLDWARKVAAGLGEKLPQHLPEIYALEAIYLHERPRTELILQALRIGDVGLTAIPNEVYALTGLKLKAQSPLQPCINIELANGAEGYIPPPEQHKLGGYTTWPARTAGLETGAEPKIVETLLSLLEEVAKKPRRKVAPGQSLYSKMVLTAAPMAYWRFEEMVIPTAHDTSGNGNLGQFEDGIALYLPGVASGSGISPNAQLTSSNFSAAGEINRAVHFAGGRMSAKLPKLGETYSVEMWFWNGLPNDARPVAGYMFSRGTNEDAQANGDHLGIGGSYQAGMAGKLIFSNGNKLDEVLVGTAVLQPKTWHHVALVREENKVTVYLDGHVEITGAAARSLQPNVPELFIGGRNDNFSNFEGKLDEVAVYDRALSPTEVKEHVTVAGTRLSSPKKIATGPLSPEESLKKIRVTDGFTVGLVAAEPLVIDPVAIDWDEAGRMWVVEMADYPMGMDGKGASGGRVRLVEDTNGDGHYDKSTLFAEGLNFPTGILLWRDGALVTAAPDILFLRDTDGDGKADEKKILFTGFPEGNQQLRINGLRWGLDNWVYCAMGAHYRGYAAGTKVKSLLTGQEIAMGSRDFRFRPDTGEFQPQSGPSQFGRNRDDWGRWFGSQNSRPLWHYVLQDEYLGRNPHVPAPDPVQQVMVPLNPKVFPASPQEKRYHSFQEAGHFTSGCSGMIYRDRLIFSEKEGIQGFACEPFHNLVHREILQDSGVSFTARRAGAEQQSEFFASEDRWCRPVMTLTGPDGAFWVVDMYRYMIEHPDWLPENGKAELLPHYRAGDDKGRIYRVVRNGTAARKQAKLNQMSATELVAALDSPNGWQRDKAQQMILWKGDKSVAPRLEQMAQNGSNAPARVHALWTLRGLGLLRSGSVAAALKDVSDGVRENALRLAERHADDEVISAATDLVNDRSAKVRLQLAFSLGEWKSPKAGEALADLANQYYEEPFMVAAVISSAVPHLEELVRRVCSVDGAVRNRFSEPLQMLTLALNRRDLLARLVEPAVRGEAGKFTAEQMRAYGAFLQLLQRRQSSVAKLIVGKIDDPLDHALQQGATLLEYSAKIAEGNIAPAEMRLAAATLLARDPQRQKRAVELLASWIEPQHSVEFQRGAIAAIGETAEASAPGLLLPKWNRATPEIRTGISELMLRREAWTWELLGRAEQDEISITGFDAAARARLKEHESKRVRELAAKIFIQGSSRTAVIEHFKGALQLRGDSKRGAEIYAQLCSSCHKHGRQGKEIGPDLSSVVEHAPEKLLVNILDPSGDVQPGFHAYGCTLKDGEELYGIITAETANSLVLKQVDGTIRTVLRSELSSVRPSNLSLMPEGLESGLNNQDLANLIAFLKIPPEKAVEQSKQ